MVCYKYRFRKSHGTGSPSHEPVTTSLPPLSSSHKVFHTPSSHSSPPGTMLQQPRRSISSGWESPNAYTPRATTPTKPFYHGRSSSMQMLHIVPPPPHFSHMLNSRIGSPFLTTQELPQTPTHEAGTQNTQSNNDTDSPRPASPAPTADYSFIDADPDANYPDRLFPNVFVPGAFPYYSNARLPPSPHWNSPGWKSSQNNTGTFRSIFPRIWDTLASPGRSLLGAVLPFSPSYSHSTLGSEVHPSPGRNRCKGKARGLFEEPEAIDYSELPPLDGEEGELIDDEACFIDVTAVTGIDILSLLPPELALNILIKLCPLPISIPQSNAYSSEEADIALRTVLACLCVSRKWNYLANDNSLWRSLFESRWGVNLDRHPRNETLPKDISGSSSRPKFSTSARLPLSSAPLQLDWRFLYRARWELDQRWAGSAYASGPQVWRKPSARKILDPSLHPATPHLTRSPNSPVSPAASRTSEKTEKWQPNIMRISGHNDSVYCLEFDSRRIVTGSRDRTIKVWSLHTGRLLGTFTGAHRGSVLCLKFEKDWDWDLGEDTEGVDEDAISLRHKERQSYDKDVENRGRKRKGFMVSGSSDCSVCVWEMETGDLLDEDAGRPGDLFGSVDFKAQALHKREDRVVKAELRSVLRGHVGGVLDLRIDEKWIVSCSKDAVIRVWDRKTLQLHRTLMGHEGPVNAVGLQTGRVVSASGDGKMILWDIATGERLRTFEGHDRGLACIEFKDNLIVSGSNDCKIKVWNAQTGECLRTLVGHEALVRALSFDPRSRRLVSASYDKSVKLWDLDSGRLMREFQGTHTSHIFDVKFDVARIVSTSHDQKIIVMDFSTGLDASLFV